MCFRKVSDMEVVANARSVGRVVIGSENREIKRSPAATFKTGGGEVTLDLALLANLSFGVRARSGAGLPPERALISS
jgi:hypothetical protein